MKVTISAAKVNVPFYTVKGKTTFWPEDKSIANIVTTEGKSSFGAYSDVSYQLENGTIIDFVGSVSYLFGGKPEGSGTWKFEVAGMVKTGTFKTEKDIIPILKRLLPETDNIKHVALGKSPKFPGFDLDIDYDWLSLTYLKEESDLVVEVSVDYVGAMFEGREGSVRVYIADHDTGPGDDPIVKFEKKFPITKMSEVKKYINMANNLSKKYQS